MKRRDRPYFHASCGHAHRTIRRAATCPQRSRRPEQTVIYVIPAALTGTIPRTYTASGLLNERSPAVLSNWSSKKAKLQAYDPEKFPACPFESDYNPADPHGTCAFGITATRPEGVACCGYHYVSGGKLRGAA